MDKEKQIENALMELDSLLREFAIEHHGEDYMQPFNSTDLVHSINNMSDQIRDAT